MSDLPPPGALRRIGGLAGVAGGLMLVIAGLLMIAPLMGLLATLFILGLCTMSVNPGAGLDSSTFALIAIVGCAIIGLLGWAGIALIRKGLRARKKRSPP